MQINFGGFNPQQMQQLQEVYQQCCNHPECNDCPYYTLSGFNGTICDNALIKLQTNNEEK